MTEYNNNGDTYTEKEIFGGDDFVLMQRTGDNGKSEFVGGGYKVRSFFLENNKPLISTLNYKSPFDDKQDGGKVSTPFENLAVPAGLFYVNQRVTKRDTDRGEHNYKKHTMLPDDIFDKLFGLVEFDKKKKRKTRKYVKITNTNNTNNTNKNKTHKHK